MKTLDYNDSNDDWHISDKFFQKNKIHISVATVANADGKPNEDAFAISEVDNCIWLAVFDGTTSLRSIPALLETSGARFASHFLKDNFDGVVATPNIKPGEVLLKLNSLLLFAAEKLGGNLSDTHSLPASMATVVCINPVTNRVSFAHVGDTYGIVYFHDSSKVFTDDKNKKFDQQEFDLMKSISEHKKISIRQARQDEMLKKELYDMFIRRNNNPNGSGSGLLNGDPNLDKYIQTGEIPLPNVKAILLATDGLEVQGFDISDDKFRNKLYADFQSGGFQLLIDLKRRSEDSDPEWNHIRYKHSDDATGLMIEFNKNG